MRKNIFLLPFFLLLIKCTAQKITIDDYKRAMQFHFRYNLAGKKVFNLNITPNWFKDSSGFSFTVQNKDGRKFNKILFRRPQAEPLFNHERMAILLTDKLGRTVKANDLPISAVDYINKDQLLITSEGKDFIVDLKSYTAEVKKRERENRMEEKSPDGKWIAFSRDNNLFIRSSQTGEEIQLSFSGHKNYEYASSYGWGDLIEGENGERPPHFNVNWSPDSKWLYTYICDLRSANKMYLLDWSVDTLYRARLLSYYRGSPGDTNMVYMIPVFFNIETKKELRQNDMRNTHINMVTYQWSKEPGIVYEYNRKRGFKEIELFKIDLNNNHRDLIYKEVSPTNIDNYDYELVNEWNKILMISEKDGWKQLYLLDEKDKSIEPVTNGAYYVNDVLYIDKKGKSIIFSASGKENGRNPYMQHIYKIGLDGKPSILLTPENANHDVSISPDGRYFIDNISSLDQPTRTVLRETSTGKIISEISKANIDDLLAMNYHFPETFTATARDERTIIYGAIWKPTNFDPSKKYPVLDQTYTGPHTNMYPGNFTTSIARANQMLAEFGFIVVTVDGMGTAGRSKAFHDVSYKNMGKNLTDHVLAIKELGRRYPWVDTTRVGIFGHSAGGYDAAHALLEFPDFYKVGVASSADHDFRMEKAWWPEMYMGWPVDSLYNDVSNITMAGNLKGKLLITHGGIDENVNPSATFKLAEALVKANKEFDMLIFPSQHHGYQQPVNDYFTKKLINYFVKHLLGAEPIWDFELKF